MTGVWALTRKELLEQRRTRKFLAMAIVFTLTAVLGPVIFRIVQHFQDKPHGVEEAVEALENIGGEIIPFFGTFLVIIIAMGSLAGERASGTAAMTLSKPVTRSAFVAAKFVGVALSIFGAVAIAGTVAYLLTLLLFANGGLGRFALGLMINATFLLYVGSIALFWSAMFSRPLLAGGITGALMIVQLNLLAIPHTDRYWPILIPQWATSIIRDDATDQWPGFAIAWGLIALLSVASWAIFRRKEL